MSKLLLSAFLIFSFVFNSKSQTLLTLNSCIEDARQLSPSYVLAKTRVKNSYWGYRTYRAGILPQVRLDAIIPSYQGGIDRVI
jgi:outer membrane protein TolC